MNMEQIETTETSAHKIRTPGNLPKGRIRHSEHGEICIKNYCFFYVEQWGSWLEHCAKIREVPGSITGRVL
jgi:hypothetical protein